LLDFEADFFGEARQFGCQQGGYAKRLLVVSNAALPVLDIGLKSYERIVHLLRQRLSTLEKPLSMSLEYGDDQIGFGGKVMMDTGLADVDGIRDVGITEC